PRIRQQGLRSVLQARTRRRRSRRRGIGNRRPQPPGARLSRLSCRRWPRRLRARPGRRRRRPGVRRADVLFQQRAILGLRPHGPARTPADRSRPQARAAAQAGDLRMIDVYFWTTPNGYKVTILLEELGLTYNVIPVHIGKGEQFNPEFLKVSPNNKIPALVDHDGPGGEPLALFESGAIMMYLAEKSGFRFMAEDP